MTRAAPKAPHTAIEPISVKIAMAVQLTGISRSRLYELIASGELATAKVGRSTLVTYASLKSVVESRVRA